MEQELQSALKRVVTLNDLKLLLPQTLEGIFGEGNDWRTIVGKLLVSTRHYQGEPTLSAVVEVAGLEDHDGQPFSLETIRDCLSGLTGVGFFEQSESPQGSRYRLNPDVKAVLEKIVSAPKT